MAGKAPFLSSGIIDENPSQTLSLSSVFPHPTPRPECYEGVLIRIQFPCFVYAFSTPSVSILIRRFIGGKRVTFRSNQFNNLSTEEERTPAAGPNLNGEDILFSYFERIASPCCAVGCPI
jgi:hypothetical protein